MKTKKRFLNRALRIMLATDMLVLIAAAMIAPIYSIYIEKIGGDILDAGITGSIFAVVAGITVLLSGKMSDQSKRKVHIVAYGYLLIGCGFVMYIFVHNIWQLCAAQVVIGLGKAIYTPAFDALYTEHIGSKKKSSSRWGIWEASDYFSLAIGALLGACIVKYAGFNVLFCVMASLCFMSGLYMLRLPKRILK